MVEHATHEMRVKQGHGVVGFGPRYTHGTLPSFHNLGYRSEYGPLHMWDIQIRLFRCVLSFFTPMMLRYIRIANLWLR